MKRTRSGDSTQPKPVIVAIVPARGGSKGIPGKNVKHFADKPLIYWSIKAGKESKYIDDVYVSTDCPAIKEVALKYGALVPFLRPAEISSDLSVDLEFMEHFLDWAKKNLPEDKYPTILVQLRPTCPGRSTELVDQCIEAFLKTDDYDCLRTCILCDRTPYKFYTLDQEKQILVPLFSEVGDITEPYNMPRQILPPTYAHNGYVDVIRSSSITEKNSVSGDKILPYLMESGEFYDIDTPKDWEEASRHFKANRLQIYKDIKLVVLDSDGVLTNGKMYYNESGESMKSFFTRDGVGIRQLQEHGIEVGIITGENTGFTPARAKKLNINLISLGTPDKLKILSGWREKLNLEWSQIAYMGDDVFDIPAMQACGYCACPKDAHEKVLDVADYVSKYPGGKGAVREFSDLILHDKLN